MKRILSFTLLAMVFAPMTLHAVARPGHKHEDLFGEEDLLIGFKLGPELTGYTPVNTGTATIDVQSSMRALGGVAFEFIYAVPRFEIDVLWNVRGGLNNSDSFHSISIPILAKLPWEIDTGVDLEFGVGYESDFVMFGDQPHRRLLQGILGSVGIAVDFETYVFSFAVRYNHGLDTVADDINGGRPRDTQMIGGMLWHF